MNSLNTEVQKGFLYCHLYEKNPHRKMCNDCHTHFLQYFIFIKFSLNKGQWTQINQDKKLIKLFEQKICIYSGYQ